MSTYPGSIDNGAIDVEYSPVTERIAAADQHYATQEQLKQLAADHEKELDELSRSVHALTWLVERLLKTPEDQSYVATEPPPARLVIDADSVPWDALRTVLMDIDATSVEYDVIDNFVLANAPKEPTE